MAHHPIFFTITPAELSEIIRISIRKELASALTNDVSLLSKHNTDTQYYTRKQTAEKLHVSLVTLNKWNKNKCLEAHKIGDRVLYLKTDIDKALENK